MNWLLAFLATARPVALFLVIYSVTLSAAEPLAHEPVAAQPAPVAMRWVPEPKAPEGVTDLALIELLKAGRGGAVDYSDKAKSLDGKLVRVYGYLVRQGQPTPWITMLSPTPQSLHEREYFLCDDLPISTIHIILPKGPRLQINYTPNPVAIVGTLQLGGREEADGRTSMARVMVPPGPGEPAVAVTNFVQVPVSPAAPVAPPAVTK